MTPLLRARLEYQQAHLRSRIGRLRETLAGQLLRWSLRGESLLGFLERHQPGLHAERLQRFEDLRQRPARIVFTFRTLHFLDWFVPIHQALERLYPGQYGVLYLDYATTLRRVGSGWEYLRYREQVQSRMLGLGVDPLLHASHEELEAFGAPIPWQAGITCESIRQERLQLPLRIYLPHYSLPKAIDRTLPENIRFEHAFLPTRPPYSYAALNDDPGSTRAMLHDVGYPKECLPVEPNRIFPGDDRPVILYAPSLEVPLLQAALRQGLVEVFRNHPEWNFVVKLHPSLESRRHYVAGFMKQQLEGLPHVRFDSLSSIQSLAGEASVLITDFGSVGGEFRMSAGKRVVFLETPRRYAGGADLQFRDDFADAVCSVEALPQVLGEVLAQGDLSQEELQEMRTRVLTWDEAPDERAAQVLHGLLQPAKPDLQA